jgi:vacuolar-type H+-ATPase subunit H
MQGDAMVSEGTRVDQGSGPVAATREQASNVAGTAKEQAAEVAQKATEQARSAFQQVMDDAKHRAGDEAGKLAESMRNTSDQLRSMADAGSQSGVAHSLVREGANAAERLASTLEQGGFEGALADVRTFARRRPGAFLFGAATLGFVAGRAVRNMSSEQLRTAAQGQRDSNEMMPYQEMPELGTNMPGTLGRAGTSSEYGETSGREEIDLRPSNPSLGFDPEGRA